MSRLTSEDQEDSEHIRSLIRLKTQALIKEYREGMLPFTLFQSYCYQLNMSYRGIRDAIDEATGKKAWMNKRRNRIFKEIAERKERNERRLLREIRGDQEDWEDQE